MLSVNGESSRTIDFSKARGFDTSISLSINRELVEPVDFFLLICHAEIVREKGFILPLVLVLIY